MGEPSSLDQLIEEFAQRLVQEVWAEAHLYVVQARERGLRRDNEPNILRRAPDESDIIHRLVELLQDQGFHA